MPAASHRITPAYAGKSAMRCRNGCACPDHPRACGEKAQTDRPNYARVGSPPCMRGKGHLTLAVSHMHRINPAYAGKSARHPDRPCGRRDHPRVCREKTPETRPLALTLGSPPRMRGKGHDGEQSPHKAGITPAYTGKRLKRSRSTVSPVAIVPLFPSVCNKPVVSNGNPASRSSQFPPRIMVISPRP